jgi:uncharacterized protein YndB with AHSA1/START domain
MKQDANTPTQMTMLSEFHVSAPQQRVWEALTHPEEWPQWWRYVEQVELLEAGNEQDVGALRRLHWGTRLPYAIDLLVRTTVVSEPRVLEVAASGDLAGQGRWDLKPTASGTRVRYTWSIQLDKPWMRRFAPLLKPVFAWNHHAVMREGAAGLARHLDATLFGYRPVENAKSPNRARLS